VEATGVPTAPTELKIKLSLCHGKELLGNWTRGELLNGGGGKKTQGGPKEKQQKLFLGYLSLWDPKQSKGGYEQTAPKTNQG